MAKYRYILCEYWTDVDIIYFCPDEKLFYIYLLTNQHTSQCGIYELSIRHIEFETGYSKEVIQGLLNKFQNVYKKIKYNYTTNEIAIKNWAKYNISTSPKVIKCINDELKKVNDVSLINYVYSSDCSFSKEIEIPNNAKDTDAPTKSECENSAADVYKTFENEIQPLTPLISEKIGFYLDNMEPSVVMEAIKETSIINKPSMRYLDAILMSWLKLGITTLEKLKASKGLYKKNKLSRKKEEDCYDISHSSYDEFIQTD